MPSFIRYGTDGIPVKYSHRPGTLTVWVRGPDRPDLPALAGFIVPTTWAEEGWSVVIGPCHSGVRPTANVLYNTLDEAIDGCDAQIREAYRNQSIIHFSGGHDSPEYASRREQLVARFEEQY